MRKIGSPKIFRDEMERLRRRGKRIGLVPTMGSLHEGHLSLIRAARKENDVVAVSIFINPLQFGPAEDLKRYPRPFERDCRLLEKLKADFLFCPSPAQMYPKGFSSALETGGEGFLPQSSSSFSCLAKRLCGRMRPGHFRGVATVVAKLFNVVRPHRAYFGEKDYQQLLIVRRLVKDLNFGITVRVLPTVREKDGLAMSSRNQYLVGRERSRALALSEALFWVRDQIQSGRRDLPVLVMQAKAGLKKRVSRIDYFDVVHPETLESLNRPLPVMRAVAACLVGRTRLIDNCEIKIRRRN
jgi:pantoate--beta-alanine ligase